MKQLLIVVAIFIFSPSVKAQNSIPKSGMPEGMKQYYFVMLIKGNNRTQDSATVAKIQEGHLANITRLANEGKCIIAGPFGDDTAWRGFLVLDVATEDEAKAEVEKDPAIISGRLAYEIHPWWTQKRTLTFK